MPSLNVRRFPDDLLHRVKLAATQQQQTIRQWVIDNLRKLVEKESKHGND